MYILYTCTNTGITENEQPAALVANMLEKKFRGGGAFGVKALADFMAY